MELVGRFTLGRYLWSHQGSHNVSTHEKPTKATKNLWSRNTMKRKPVITTPTTTIILRGPDLGTTTREHTHKPSQILGIDFSNTTVWSWGPVRGYIFSHHWQTQHKSSHIRRQHHPLQINSNNPKLPYQHNKGFRSQPIGDTHSRKRTTLGWRASSVSR